MANERYLKPDDQSGEKTPSGTAGLLDHSEIPLSSPLFDTPESLLLVRKMRLAAILTDRTRRQLHALITPFAARRAYPGSGQSLRPLVFGASSSWLADMLRPKCLCELFAATAQAIDPLG